MLAANFVLAGFFVPAANFVLAAIFVLAEIFVFCLFCPKSTMVMARLYAHLTTPFWGKLEEAINKYFVIGAQLLSGRVLDSRPRGRGFEPHWRHYVVPLCKTH